MRNAFAKEVLEIARRDERVVLLMGDIGNRLFDPFKAEFPERFFNCGIAEANMISVAAGLANEGFRPVCYTIAPFVTYRVLEQIRVDVCYHQQPVTLVGTGAGLSYAGLGATHHSCEDIAVMRALPDMQVLAPADSNELVSCLNAAITSDKATYLRIGKKGEPLVYEAPPKVRLGSSLSHRKGRDVAILSCGTLLSSALEASELLGAKGIQCSVTSCYSVKPMDESTVREKAKESRLLVSLEEHSVVGGFGSAVAELLSSPGEVAKPLLRLGTADEFLHETSTQPSAREHFGLLPHQIAESIEKALKQL